MLFVSIHSLCSNAGLARLPLAVYFIDEFVWQAASTKRRLCLRLEGDAGEICSLGYHMNASQLGRLGSVMLMNGELRVLWRQLGHTLVAPIPDSCWFLVSLCSSKCFVRQIKPGRQSCDSQRQRGSNSFN